MATVTGTRRLLDISGNNISTAVSLEAEGTLLDSNGQSGTSNQVLISTATGVDWVDGSGSSVIGGPYVPLSGGSSTGQAMTGTLYGPGARFSVSGNNSTNLIVGDGFYLLEMGRTSIQARVVGSSGAAAPLNLNPNGGDVKFVGSGNVGIGTTSPSHKLDIYSNENIPLRVHRPSNANLNSTGAWGIGFSTRGDATTSTTDTRAGIFSYYNGNLFLAANNSNIASNPYASARLTILNSGNVEINNGQLSLGGTGRIQGVDTVTDNTDAANKLYVDNAVAGVPQGDITAIVAGSGMTGTSLSGPIPTLNVIGGDGITANADDIEVDSTVVRTTGAQTIAGEKTFTNQLAVDTAGGSERMRLFNENNTAPIADSFSGDTSKSYIYFDTVAGSNDPGYIMHESSATETNEGVLHLVPSDDNATDDYVSIHGTNDPDVLKLHTSGLIETVNLQLQLKSGSGSIYLNDGVSIEGDLSVSGGDITLGGTGRIQGVDTVTDGTDAANKTYVDNAVAGVPGESYINAATFNTSDGIITGTGVGSAGFTVDIDGRYPVGNTTNQEFYIHLQQNPVGTTYGDTVATVPSYYFGQRAGDNDGMRIYAESAASNDVTAVWEITDDLETGLSWLFRNKKTYSPYTTIDALKIDGDGDITVGKDLTITGGDIILSGTGRIQGVDTVSAGTDAANKAYVDASVPTVNNGTLTMTTNTGLDGGATFTANQSGNSAFAVSLDLSELTDMTTTMVGTDEFIVLDNGAERRKAANEIGLSIFNNDSGFLLDTTDTFAGTLTIDGELEMANGPDGIIYTSDDILTLSSGGKTGGTNIAIDDGSSVIKLNADTIAQSEFKVSSLTDGTGDDVFRAVVTSSAASFSLGDIEGIGDGSYIVSDGTTIKLRNNGGVNTLVTDNSNNVEIPNGTLTVNGSTTADSLIKDGGTSSQFLKADGSVDSNTYLTTETGARMVQFNRSGINASTYTMLATVNGNNLASILKMTMTGTSGGVVFACTFDITVNHSTDIHVKSSNGDYTEVTLRITSNNNEDFSIEAKHNGGSTTTAEVCIYPLADEVITPTTTDPGYTGAEYEHTATEGWRFGGEDGNVESSNVIVDGKIGVGTTTPAGLLEVKGAAPYIYISDTTETDSGIIFRDIDAGLSQAAAIKFNSSNNKLQFYNNDTAAVRMTIDTAGNVGIGTTGPNYPLVVNGVSAANRFYVPNATATTAWVLQARNSANTADSGLYFENGDAQLLLRDDSNNLNVRINADTNSYINGGNLGVGTTNPDARLTSFRNVSSYAVSRGDVSTRAGLSVKSSSNYDSKLNFATGLNSQQYIQGLNNAATTGRPIVLNPYGGYVGINTANLPTQQLDIISGTNNGIRISATDNQTWRDIGIRSYVTEGQANALADHTFIYTTNPSSGTEDPFGKFGATVIQGRDNGNSGFAIRLGNGGGHATRMWMGGTGATTFSNTVTATNFILSSDERLKENIEQVCDNRVKADWKTFELKTEKGQKRYGVIAQELEKTNPEFVREDSQGFKSVAYIDLLIAKIAELESRLEKLEK